MSQLNDPHALDQLVSEVQGSAKYRDISLDLIRTIAAQELPKRRTLKEAVKATKNKLHQISGAYLDPREHYAAWLQEIREAQHSKEQEIIKRTHKHIIS